jgi:pimeloyl-ACP methyl ester carboxylesterase
MKAQEARAVTHLGVQAYAGAVSHIEKAHIRLASLSYRHVPIGGALQAVHDSIARTAYRAVREAGTVAGTAVAGLLPVASAGLDQRPIGSSGRSNHMQAALNAAIGDRLSDDHNPLAIRTALRSEGRDITVDRDSLRRVVRAATSKIAVFVHGLGESDDSWRLGSGRGGHTYGGRLAAEFGYADLYVRCNSSRHVSQNGRDLSGLLGEIVTAWPWRVEEVLLLGHSMGGLVIRSACHYGQESAARWIPRVRHVFLLGSPNLGAPLARWTRYPAQAAAKRKDTLPFAPLLTTRSAGIDDLRFGYLLDDDWEGCDTETCGEDHRHDVPLLATANHYTISATVTRTAGNPLAEVLGDLLVQPASAHGRHRRHQHIPFAIENSDQFCGRHHFDLLNDPGVYAAMRTRLAASSHPSVS